MSLEDILFDPYFSQTREKLKHIYDDFWESVEEGKHKAILNSAREFGEDAPWKEISKQIKETDIDFIREFKQFIQWDEVNTDIIYDSNIKKEFGREIDKERKFKTELQLKTLEMMIHDLH